MDPKQFEYPELSPYNFAANSPLFFIDPDGEKIVPSDAFKGTNYEKVHNYLIKTNTSYKNMLGKYTDQNNEQFVLNFGTDDSKIPTGSGGFTRYSRSWNTNKVQGKTKIEITNAKSNEDFVSSGSNNNLTLWHFYIMIHEGTHSSEALTTKTMGIGGDHDAFTKVIENNIATFSELNTDLNLGLSKEDITILSFGGAEGSKSFDSYISKQATDNNTTKEAARATYDTRKKELYNMNIDKTKISEDKPNPDSKEKSEDKK